MQQPRKRSENWLEEDKIILKNLIKEHVAVIENKNIDTNTNNKKAVAWTNVHDGFNSMARTPRTLKQIKNQWCFIKIIEKKKIFMNKKDILKTGGGPASVVLPPLDSDDIAAWLPNEFLIGSNEFDSDSRTIAMEQENQEPIEIHEHTEQLGNTIHLIHPDLSDLKKQDPKQKHKQNDNNDENHAPCPKKTLKTNIRTTRNKKQLNTAKRMIADNEIACRKELHQLQMKNEELKHQNLLLKNRFIKLQIEHML